MRDQKTTSTRPIAEALADAAAGAGSLGRNVAGVHAATYAEACPSPTTAPPVMLAEAPKVIPSTLTPPQRPWRDFAAASVNGCRHACPSASAELSQAVRILPTQAQRRVASGKAGEQATAQSVVVRPTTRAQERASRSFASEPRVSGLCIGSKEEYRTKSAPVLTSVVAVTDGEEESVSC